MEAVEGVRAELQTLGRRTTTIKATIEDQLKVDQLENCSR